MSNPKTNGVKDSPRNIGSTLFPIISIEKEEVRRYDVLLTLSVPTEHMHFIWKAIRECEELMTREFEDYENGNYDPCDFCASLDECDYCRYTEDWLYEPEIDDDTDYALEYSDTEARLEAEEEFFDPEQAEAQDAIERGTFWEPEEDE